MLAVADAAPRSQKRQSAAADRRPANVVVAVRAVQRARRRLPPRPSRQATSILVRTWASLQEPIFLMSTPCTYFASCMRPDARLKRMRAASAVILRLRCRRIGARRRILRAEHFQYRTDGAREGRDHDGVSRVRVVEQAARGANIFRFARSKLCCAPEFEFDFALSCSR